MIGLNSGSQNCVFPSSQAKARYSLHHHVGRATRPSAPPTVKPAAPRRPRGHRSNCPNLRMSTELVLCYSKDSKPPSRTLCVITLCAVDKNRSYASSHTIVIIPTTEPDI
jgi:hypothetical protein